MKLSIWHCLVLYCCGNASIEKLSSLSGLAANFLNQERVNEKWDLKRAQFLKLSPKQKMSFDILELLFGEFQADERKREFMQKVLDKLKTTKKPVKVDKGEIKLQKVSQLTEFGMSHEQATAFVEDVEKNLASGKAIASDDLLDVIPAELSIQDKLDTVNQSYRGLVSGYNSQQANYQKILETAIEFNAEEIRLLEAKQMMLKRLQRKYTP